MKEPEIVPDKIKSPFDLRALVGIAVLVISFHIIVNFVVTPEDSETIVSVFSILNPLIVTSIGFFVAMKYRGTQVFGKSLIYLSFGFLSVFLAEVTYSIYDIIFDIDPYPSIADIFFFMLYPLLIAYLVINIKFFTKKINNYAKIWIIAMPIAVLAGYSTLSISEEIDILGFDFWYGIIFVYIVSQTLSIAVVGAAILKQGIIGKAWLLLAIGILLLMIGDVWYYNLELFEGYDLTHPVNLFWYGGYWIIVYGLYKHKKDI